MDVATWNINSLRARPEVFERYGQEFGPDVICLQETKAVDEEFPHEVVEAAGYPHRAIYGQKTYNGVAIVSKRPLEDVVLGFTDAPEDPQRRLIRATVDGVRLVNCYVPNGEPLGSEKFTYKLEWLGRLHHELTTHEADHEQLLLCGDMNVAPTPADVYDPFEAEGHVLYTEPEREALQKVLKRGLVDAFRKKNPFSSEYSWWNYQRSAFRHNHGYRIDHIFVTRPLMRRCRKVRIDREPRTWDKPSDHTPVVATFRER